MRKLTQEEVIERFVAKHGDQYDYSKVVYTTMREEVVIGCKRCGNNFNRTPGAHLHGCKGKGNGCPHCCDNKLLTKEEFIRRAAAIHGNLYDYSLVKYLGNKIEVDILCNTCGKVFPMRPNNHLSEEQGCPYCKGFYRTTEEAIRDFKSVWGDEYDYSLAEYVNTATKIKVLCKKHGEFEALYHHHMNEVGCPTCGKGGFDVNKDAWFYILHCGSFVGVGITSDLKVRMQNHKRNLDASGYSFRLFGVRQGEGKNIKQLEADVLNTFKKHKIRVEVEGFRRESIDSRQFINILRYVEDYNLKENRPEGRLDLDITV